MVVRAIRAVNRGGPVARRIYESSFQRRARREAQAALAAGQINRRVARENKTPELLDGIADLQRARQAASTRIGDPIGSGLVPSLARPGGNLTGLSVLNAELSAKRLELLREIVPGLSRGAVLWNVANPANGLAWKDTEGAARVLGVTLQSQEVREPKDFAGAFAAMAQQRPDAFLVLQDALTLLDLTDRQHAERGLDTLCRDRRRNRLRQRLLAISRCASRHGPSSVFR